jgi:hypothetical protein
VEQQPQPSADVEQPNPAELQRLITELDQLPNREFTRAFREYVVDQSSLEQAAYRSYQLAEKSLAAAKKIMNDVNADLRRREKQDADWAASARRFRNLVGQEAGLIRSVVAALRQQAGHPVNSPNLRWQAAIELTKRHPVEYLEILRDLQARQKEQDAHWRAVQRQKRR